MQSAELFILQDDETDNQEALPTLKTESNQDQQCVTNTGQTGPLPGEDTTGLGEIRSVGNLTDRTGPVEDWAGCHIVERTGLGEELTGGRTAAVRELVLDVSCASYLDRKGAELIGRLAAEARRRGWWVGVAATPWQAPLLAGMESQLFPTYSDAIHIARRRPLAEDEDFVVTRL